MADGPLPETALRVCLLVQAGPHAGQSFAFDRHDTFIVGRGKQAHFRLPREDEYFSRVHFLIEVNPPHCRLMDLGSTNGTHVNGQRVTSIDLKDGDLIQGGQTVIRVQVEATAPEPPSPTDDDGSAIALAETIGQSPPGSCASWAAAAWASSPWRFVWPTGPPWP